MLGWPASIAAALIALPALAAAAPGAGKIAVLPALVAGPHGEATEASVQQDVAEVVRYRAGLSLMAADELFPARGPSLGEDLRGCGSDSSCLVARLHDADVALGLIVVANLQLEPPFLSLILIDGARSRVAGRSGGAVDLARGSLSAAIREQTAKVLGEAGFALAGRLVVEVSPAGAKLGVSGGQLAESGSGSTFVLAPGRYTLLAELAGYRSEGATVDVTAGREAHVALILEEAPGISASPWLWIAVGVAIAGGTAAAIVATRSSDGCLCVTSVGGACQPCP